MVSRAGTVSMTCAACVAIAALGIAPDRPARAQSADLALCDRIAADPSDPDKPADVKGVRDIAPSDIATAIKYCRIAGAKSRRALYQLGRAHAAAQQWPEAAGAYRRAIDKGSTTAMVELGVMFGTGTGVASVTNLAALTGGAPPSDPRSRALFVKAAESGSPEAQYQLGLMAADGIGGPRDDVAARRWFEKAAAQGHPGALERMGAFAQSGRGGPRDASAAKAYFEKAAALGNEDAKAALQRARCPYVIKDKSGRVVTNLCF